MLNRNFTKSNKEYFNKNKIALIVLLAVLVVGIIVVSCFGFKTNFETGSHTEFTVAIHTEDSKTIRNYSKDIEAIVKKQGGEFDTISIFGEGDNTKLVVRYLNILSSDKQTAIRDEIVSELKIELLDVSDFSVVSSAISANDYIYTALAIILLVAFASIFAYARYNGASAISIIISSIIATLGFMSVTGILRLTVGLSYFAMLVILNLLVVLGQFMMFENIRDSNWLANKEYSNAINGALKSNRAKMFLISFSLIVIGLMFVIFAPAALKYVSLNLMFMAVVLLFTIWYVVPFVWSVFITHTKPRLKKNKENKVKEK